jgi:FkbH-like protein
MVWNGLGLVERSSPNGPAHPAKRLSALLRRDRHALAARLLQNLAGWEKYDQEIKHHQGDLDAYVALEFHVFVDYLDRYFATGDDTYKSLYVGEKLKQFHDSSLTPQEDDANRRRVLAADAEVLGTHVHQELGGESARMLEALLGDIHPIVTAHGRKELKILFLGDCLFLDVRGFVAPLTLQEGVSHAPTFVGTKNAIEQRTTLRGLADRRFDLIFYSPFTYEFSLEFTALHNWRRSLASSDVVRAVSATVMADVERNLDLLTSLFDCPIYLHNTLNIVRHDSSLTALAKATMTLRTRRLARSLVNSRLAELVAARRKAGANVILLDEVALFERYGEYTLGRTIYATPIQHPAELGRLAAHHYCEIMLAHADLVGKKVLVSDLDNTLWQGEIGEGAVEHFLDLQQTLRELRHKGVLLTVNSKNDPKNVRWDGAVLSAEDFVDLQINWESKVVNMRRTQEALNLKFKDFVFIDDRADQRTLVQEAIPEIHVLDAASSRSWKQLALWAAALPDDPQTDRTLLYRQRQQREGFIAATAAVEEDQSALFAKLEIKAEIRLAKESELTRVTELINRTNQFNLAGSRTSLKEIREWHRDPHKRVIVVDASDKFGPMGLICATLLDLAGPELGIPVFVLSCRVFGYGIEHAVLSAIKRLARDAFGGNVRPIRGAYRETAHNEPCRKMYPENGFSPEHGSWVIRQIAPSEYPAWLAVTVNLERNP